MSNNKRMSSTTNGIMTTGGLGALFTVAVQAIFPEQSDWKNVSLAAIPMISAIITYFSAWFINRHGLESPADAATRARLLRDLKTVDKQLKVKGISTEFKYYLKLQRENTVKQLINIGKSTQVIEVHADAEDTEPAQN